MLFRESETIELKEIVADEIKKEIIAFAILQRKGCGRRAYMSGRVVLRFLLPTRQFAV